MPKAILDVKDLANIEVKKNNFIEDRNKEKGRDKEKEETMKSR